MHVFVAQRKRRITNELKYWVLTIAGGLALAIILTSFTSLSQGKLISGICFISILYLRDTIVQYHVKEVRIVPESKQVVFVLGSIMSGTEIRCYEVSQVHSAITKRSSFTSLFGYGTTLRINLPTNKHFRITTRYGFPEETLADIDAGLKKIQAGE